MEVFENPAALVRTRRWWLFALYFVVAAIALGAVLGLTRIDVRMGMSLSAGLIAIMFVLLGGWSHWPRAERLPVRAQAGTLRVGARVIERSQIRSTRVRHRGGETFVHFRVRYRMPIEIVVADDTEAQTLLAAMHLDSARAVESYALGFGSARSVAAKSVSLVVGTFVLTMALLPVLASSWMLLALVEATILALYTFLLFRLRVTAAVGADGVRIRRWLASTDFYAYREIDSVALERSNIRLALRHGSVVVLSPAGAIAARLVGTEEDAKGFVERIRERIESATPGEPKPVALGRRGASVREWIDRLSAAGETHALFRQPAFPRNVLWRVVEDSKAPQADRAGALIALRDRLDDDERSRLRAAAHACASPRLRVVLDAAAGDNDHVFTHALDEIEDDDDRVRRAL